MDSKSYVQLKEGEVIFSATDQCACRSGCDNHLLLREVQIEAASGTLNFQGKPRMLRDANEFVRLSCCESCQLAER